VESLGSSLVMLVHSSLPIRLLTHNIRYDKQKPLFPGESEWAIRCPRQVAEYRFNTAHAPAAFICLQEALHHQVTDILHGLNSGPAAEKVPSVTWEFVGEGRDDSSGGNEYNPILYQPAIWDLQQWRTRWLSKTPKVPGSKWPGIGLARIVTIAQFKHRASGFEVLVMCTHLDHTSAEARAGQAKLIAQFAAEFSRVNAAPDEGSNELPVILAGDFNSEPHEAAYQHLTNESPFVDAWIHVPDGGYRYGNEETFTSFRPIDRPTRIDFIFLRKCPTKEAEEQRTELGRWKIEGAAVLSNVFQDGIYLSDHRAVVVDALLAR
jgi:endonuclease/exonuclease/phosphatase family metal-dependent hydrolase